jgi:Ser/Thr protein kinase RdoA (MazF antagonist)
MSSAAEDAASYEQWLLGECEVVESDLQRKHERMRRSPFDFLRASYFRWARTIEQHCPQFADAPQPLCVGDTHVENFGTWRDGQARLVWGLNDFDEAAAMPYAYDVIRLATSARLAPTLQVDAADAAAAILSGYIAGLLQPAPLLLDERAHWLRSFILASAQSPKAFWGEIDEHPDATPPTAVRKLLKHSLPAGAEVIRFATRSKGGGSLGRPRYLVIAKWQGGRLVREAKALVPSAWIWAHPGLPRKNRFIDLATGPSRAPDPELSVGGGFVVRRISVDAHKLNLGDIAEKGLNTQLLSTMGEELGSVHAAQQHRQILRHLEQLDPRWLVTASEAAEHAVRADFKSLPPLG